MIYFIVAVRMRVFADISKETLPKRTIYVNIESLSIFDIKIFVIRIIVYLSLEHSCAQEGASLIRKQRAVKKKNAYLCQHQATRTKRIQSILKTV